MGELGLELSSIDLMIGGLSWCGWTFGRWGRARDWRLIAPDGASYTAGEIGELRKIGADLDYLRSRVRELEQLASADAWYLAPADAQMVRAAAALLVRALGTPRGRSPIGKIDRT